jgi:hypothetical protein
LARKPWTTTEWKKKRAELLIGKKCEKCGSTEIPLSIHHENTFYPNFERSRIARQMINEYFREDSHKSEMEEIRHSVLKKIPIIFTQVCPDCGNPIQSRKKMSPKFRCSNCDNNFDTPARRINKNLIPKLNKAFFYEFCILHENEINAKLAPMVEKADKEYLDFKDVVVLCKRCHMAVTKGYDLCPVCKTRYARVGYSQCYECYLKTKEGKEYLNRKQEIKELEEEDNEEMEKIDLFRDLVAPCDSCKKFPICKVRQTAIDYAAFLNV